MTDQHAGSPSPAAMPCSQARTELNFNWIRGRAKRVFAHKAGSFVFAAVLFGFFPSLDQAQTLVPAWNQQLPATIPPRASALPWPMTPATPRW